MELKNLLFLVSQNWKKIFFNERFCSLFPILKINIPYVGKTQKII